MVMGDGRWKYATSQVDYVETRPHDYGDDDGDDTCNSGTPYGVGQPTKWTSRPSPCAKYRHYRAGEIGAEVSSPVVREKQMSTCSVVVVLYTLSRGVSSKETNTS